MARASQRRLHFYSRPQVGQGKRAGIVIEGIGQARTTPKIKHPTAFASNGINWYQINMLNGQGRAERLPLTPRIVGHGVCLDSGETGLQTSHLRMMGASGNRGSTSRAMRRRWSRSQTAVVAFSLATGTGNPSPFTFLGSCFSQSGTAWRAARRPRILFLADRNILADKPFNTFSAFPKGVCCHIDPSSILKKAGAQKTPASSSRSSKPSPQEKAPSHTNNTDQTSSTSSSLMSATEAAPETKASGGLYWSILSQLFSLASRQPPNAPTMLTPTTTSVSRFISIH